MLECHRQAESLAIERQAWRIFGLSRTDFDTAPRGHHIAPSNRLRTAAAWLTQCVIIQIWMMSRMIIIPYPKMEERRSKRARFMSIKRVLQIS